MFEFNKNVMSKKGSEMQINLRGNMNISNEDDKVRQIRYEKLLFFW